MTVIRRAQQQRKNLTVYEQILWRELRNSQLDDVKFRRQAPIGNYIADFYAPLIGLVVECDGPVHEETRNALYDRVRDEDLEAQGIRVLRIRNEDIQEHLPDVLLRIRQAIWEQYTAEISKDDASHRAVRWHASVRDRLRTRAPV